MVVESHAILLYDGHCVLCNYAVKKVLKWDKKDQIRLAALQSDIGQKLLSKFQVPKDLDSIILIKDSQAYFRSQAFEKLLTMIRPWHWMRWKLKFLPVKLADFFYNIVANYRYKWFGSYDVCPMLPPEFRHKILK